MAEIVARIVHVHCIAFSFLHGIQVKLACRYILSSLRQGLVLSKSESGILISHDFLPEHFLSASCKTSTLHPRYPRSIDTHLWKKHKQIVGKAYYENSDTCMCVNVAIDRRSIKLGHVHKNKGLK